MVRVLFFFLLVLYSNSVKASNSLEIADDSLLDFSLCKKVTNPPTFEMRLINIDDTRPRDVIRDLIAAALSEPQKLSAAALYDAAVEILRTPNQNADNRVRACDLFQRSARRGQNEGYTGLGELLLATARDPSQKNQAMLALQRAAGKGSRAAWLRQAEAEASAPDASASDRVTSFNTVRSLAEQGYPYAELTLGRFYENGVGGHPSGANARSWYESAAHHGVSEAEEALGGLYMQGSLDLTPDLPLAAQWFETAFEHGRVRAAVSLGRVFLSPRNRNRDVNLAMQWFERGAATGNLTAKAEIAGMLAFVLPAEKRDPKKACTLAREAANAENAKGALILSNLMEAGVGCIQDRSEAMRWLRKSSDMGNVEAMLLLGKKMIAGIDVARDVVGGKKLIERSAASGLVGAICTRGLVELDGTAEGVGRAKPWLIEGVKRAWPPCQMTLGSLIVEHKFPDITDPLVGVTLIAAAAEAGDTRAQSYLGALYAIGKVVQNDDAKALPYLEKAAGAGDSTAIFNLGGFYLHGRGGLEADSQKAIQLFEKGIQLNDVRAVMALAETLSQGQAIPSDIARAVTLWERAADLGSTDAMNILSSIYQGARSDVKADFARAVHFAQKSADLDNPMGLSLMGDLTRLGHGVPMDLVKAYKYYEKAAKLGDLRAANAMGMAYLAGLAGYPKDIVKSKIYFEQAAKQGNANALMSLASLSFDPSLGQQDGVNALAYITLAIARGEHDLVDGKMEEAQQFRDALKSHLSAADIDRAEKLSFKIANSFPKP